jgi:hypothetical protein
MRRFAACTLIALASLGIATAGEIRAQAPLLPTPSCPPGVGLTVISAPLTQPGWPAIVQVALSRPVNLKPESAGDPTALLLFYLVDNLLVPPEFAIPVGDTSSTIAAQPGGPVLPGVPSRSPKIIASASSTVDLGVLQPGPHVVFVELGQSDHLACEANGSVNFSAVPPLPPSSVLPQPMRPPGAGDGGLLPD